MKKIFIAAFSASIGLGAHAFNFSDANRGGYKPDKPREKVAQMVKKSSVNVKAAFWHDEKNFSVVVEKRNVDYKFFASLMCEIIASEGIQNKFIYLAVTDVDEVYYGKGGKHLASGFCGVE